MKEKIKIIYVFIVILFLLIPFSLAYQNLEDKNLPNKEEMLMFIDTIVETYNNKVINNAIQYPEFFPLYYPTSKSFNVIVKKPDNKRTDCLYLIFEPINSEELKINLDYNGQTYFKMFRGLLSPEKLCSVALTSENYDKGRRTLLNYPDGETISVPYNFMINTSIVLSNRSYKYAKEIGKKNANIDLFYFRRRLLYNNFMERDKEWGKYYDKCNLRGEINNLLNKQLMNNLNYNPNNFENDLNKIEKKLYYCKSAFFKKIGNSTLNLLKKNPLSIFSIWIEEILRPYTFIIGLILGIFPVITWLKVKKKIGNKKIKLKDIWGFWDEKI